MPTNLEGFDPRSQIVNLRGKEYLEVKWRLVWLRKDHPDAVIETELVSHIQNPPMAIFKARVSIPGGGSATGWGQEEAADFGDYLEKAETKSLGRALAALGFGTQFTDDYTFDETHERLVDVPVQRKGLTEGQQQAANAMDEIRSAPPIPKHDGPPRTPPAPPPTKRAPRATAPRPAPASAPPARPAQQQQNGNGSPPVTAKQLGLIYKLGRDIWGNEEECKDECKRVTGKTPEELTVRTGSAFIEYLNGKAEQ